jgi:ribosome-binding protein aMBF1 (putative translation factor)
MARPTDPGKSPKRIASRKGGVLIYAKSEYRKNPRLAALRKNIAESIKIAREQCGLNQTAAAKALGRSQSFVSRCESGNRIIDLEVLVLFSDLYKKPLSFFFDKA